MIKLYGMALSNNVSKVRYCLNHLGLDYELIELNLTKRENRTKEFQKISPFTKIPAIDDDGFYLFESNAINRYLADKEASALYPKDLKQRAVIDAWLDFASIHIGHAAGRVTYNRVLAPMIGLKSDEASIKTGLSFLNKYLPVIDTELAKRKFIASDALSLADLSMLAMLDPFELSDMSLNQYKHIVRWREELKIRAFYTLCYDDFTRHVQVILASRNR